MELSQVQYDNWTVLQNQKMKSWCSNMICDKIHRIYWQNFVNQRIIGVEKIMRFHNFIENFMILSTVTYYEFLCEMHINSALRKSSFFLDWCFISQSNLWQLMKKHGELLQSTVIHCTRNVERVSRVVVWLIIICRKLILYRICKTLGDKNILQDNGLSQHLLRWVKILKKKPNKQWTGAVL